MRPLGTQTYPLQYGYNLAGQLVSETYPSGKVINTPVDNFGGLSTVSDSQRTYLSGVSINNQGLLAGMTLGNGTSETFNYNDRFQMTSQSLNKGAEVLQKYDYFYGQTDLATGNIDGTKNNGQLGKIEGTIGTVKQWSQRFGYDELGRLKEAREYRGDNNSLTYKQVFDFDRFGNLYRKAANNFITGQQNPLPYTPIEDADISKSTNRFATGTTYDEAGQVVNDAKFRSIGFAYDANGRQVKATKTGVPDAWTVYDALGNRVATKINDIWQFVVYDAFGKLVAEYGSPSASGTGGVKYIQQDWQGSVRTVTSNTGSVVGRTDNTAFGEEIGAGIGLRTPALGYSANSATLSRQGYGSTEKDDATGLNHTWFRKNENRAGRFTSPDPYKGSMSLGDPQSFNRYSYVENEPTNFIDPSGLDNCGINPVTNRPGINAVNSGTPGELRPGVHGGGNFGARRNNKGRIYSHRGSDIAAPVGSQVFAFAPGRVLSITGSVSSIDGFGLNVIVDHGGGYTSLYGHLSSTEGLIVGGTAATLRESGQIGESGQSGNASGQDATEAHVHFEIRKNGVPLNPQTFLNSPCPKGFRNFNFIAGGGGGGGDYGGGYRSYGWGFTDLDWLWWWYEQQTHVTVRVL